MNSEFENHLIVENRELKTALTATSAALKKAQGEREAATAKRDELNALVVELRNEENGQRQWRWMQDIMKVCPEAGIASVCSVAVKVICRRYTELSARLSQLEGAQG